jgi:hypothetical protein
MFSPLIQFLLFAKAQYPGNGYSSQKVQTESLLMNVVTLRHRLCLTHINERLTYVQDSLDKATLSVLGCTVGRET